MKYPELDRLIKQFVAHTNPSHWVEMKEYVAINLTGTEPNWFNLWLYNAIEINTYVYQTYQLAPGGVKPRPGGAVFIAFEDFRTNLKIIEVKVDKCQQLIVSEEQYRQLWEYLSFATPAAGKMFR